MSIDPETRNTIMAFMDGLAPTDVGMEVIGSYQVHFEGFSDMCLDDVERRQGLAPDDPDHVAGFDDVEAEVLAEFRQKCGRDPEETGLIDGENPIIYAVFRAPEPTPEP